MNQDQEQGLDASGRRFTENAPMTKVYRRSRGRWSASSHRSEGERHVRSETCDMFLQRLCPEAAKRLDSSCSKERAGESKVSA